MDPNSGKLYTDAEVARMDREQADRLVRITGSEASIRKVSKLVERGTRKDRRKAARKAQRAARRANR